MYICNCIITRFDSHALYRYALLTITNTTSVSLFFLFHVIYISAQFLAVILLLFLRSKHQNKHHDFAFYTDGSRYRYPYTYGINVFRKLTSSKQIESSTDIIYYKCMICGSFEPRLNQNFTFPGQNFSASFS